MVTNHPMSTNSSCFIKLHNLHCPFASSCATMDLSSISSPMQTINHPLVTLLILTNNTPPTSAPYQSPNFHANVGSQSYTFSNPFDHAQLRHSPPLTLLVPIVGHDHTLQPTPIFLIHFQLSLKLLCPTCGRQFTSQRLICH